MARAYIVEGTTGEYSDQQAWPVAVFIDTFRAHTFADKANEWLREHKMHEDCCTVSGPRSRQDIAHTSPFDPQLQVDYTGASYGVVSSRLNPELPR